jgi:hypothetical protein
MSNSKLYQPPPPPPKPRAAPVDPLMALSKAPTVIAEQLTDLTDDEGLEEWAKGGTRVMPKPQSQPPPQPAPTMVAGPLPSFYPVAYSTPPRIAEKRASAAIWLVPIALFILAGGIVAAAGGYYVYHTHELALAAADTITVATTATETAPPAVTLTPTVTATATSTPTSTLTITSTSTKRVGTSTSPSASTSFGTGTIRTFAAGNGKPVYVDGKQVGYGGSKITTACGRHTVAVGTGHAKSVDIPCNGPTITIGTPDGT